MDSSWIAGVGLSSRCPVRGSDSEGQRFTSGSLRAGGSSSPEHGRSRCDLLTEEVALASSSGPEEGTPKNGPFSRRAEGPGGIVGMTGDLRRVAL